MSKIFYAILLIVAPGIMLAQKRSVADTLLDRLTGNWILSGIIDGKPVRHSVTAKWVLGHEYIELKETSDEKKADGRPQYDAIVFICYNTDSRQYDCLWLDNTSDKGLSNGIIAHGEYKPNLVTLLFKFSEKITFHTTFTLDANEDRWHWKMESEESGKFEPFADALMTKTQ